MNMKAKNIWKDRNLNPFVRVALVSWCQDSHLFCMVFSVFFFLRFFDVDHFLKVFIEFVTLLLFYVLVFWPPRHVGP